MLQTFLKKFLEKIVVREHNFLMYAKKTVLDPANDCFCIFLTLRLAQEALQALQKAMRAAVFPQEYRRKCRRSC